MSTPGDIAGDQLRAVVERIETIDEEIKELTEAKKEIYLEAKGNGFDVKILREVIRVRKQDQRERDELETLLEPILLDRADFVSGSRRLGAEGADSRLRWVGVRVFAVLASILTRRKLTDTSFGFRAMRAELATAVTLREPQYQSSELLLGALALGARVVELPMTMRRRGDGSSKKGPGVVYGANYGRVMTTTWIREYVLRRRRQAGSWRTPADRTARTSR